MEGYRMSAALRVNGDGRPDLATAAQGKMLLEHASARLFTLLRELAAADWPR